MSSLRLVDSPSKSVVFLFFITTQDQQTVQPNINFTVYPQTNSKKSRMNPMLAKRTAWLPYLTTTEIEKPIVLYYYANPSEDPGNN